MVSPEGRWIGKFSTMFSLWKMNALASAAFFCSKNDLEDAEGSVGILSEFGAEAVKISVLKVSLHRTSNDFLLEGAAADWDMILFATICSRFAFMLSRMEGSVMLIWEVEELFPNVTFLKMECIALHFIAMAAEIEGVVGTA